MASGDTVGILIKEMPPSSSYAQLNVRSGGSTIGEVFPMYEFDAATDEVMDYLFVLDNYAGGGLTVTIFWSAATATSGNVVWTGAIRRIADDAEDIDSSHTYDANSSTVAAPSVSGEVGYDTITFTNGADMDALADGEFFVFRLSRDADNGSDTMAGDAEVYAIVIRET